MPRPPTTASRVARVADGWRSVRLDEIEPIPVVSGTLLWRPVRRTLDVGAFGINAYVARKAGDDVVEETLDAPDGTAVFVHDPSVKRHARAEEDGTSVLAVGGLRGSAYEVSGWEHSFAAERHRASGDYEAMAAEIAAGLEQHPDNASLLYDLGCAEALAGRTDDALSHVSRALELKPEWADHARTDPDLAAVREHPCWPLDA